MRKLRITIGNKSYDVTVEDLTEGDPPHRSSGAVAPESRPASASPSPGSPPSGSPTPAPTRVAPPGAAEAGAVTSPMAGVIRAVLVKPSDHVKQGQPLIVLEAMKMENEITAPQEGTVQRVDVAVGESVGEGHVLVVLE